MGRAAKLKAVEKAPELKLDLGCGKHPREGFTGVDLRDFGQPVICDLAWAPKRIPGLIDPVTKKDAVFLKSGFVAWPWKSGSVDEAHCSHFIEHLTAQQRIHFVNELYRVLKPGAKCQVVVPHWASCRAYGDLTHQWPPVSEFWFYYLSKTWRAENAPHNDGYECDFDVTWGYSLRADVQSRNAEYQQFAIANHKEAAQDLIATMVKKV